MQFIPPPQELHTKIEACSQDMSEQREEVKKYTATVAEFSTDIKTYVSVSVGMPCRSHNPPLWDEAACPAVCAPPSNNPMSTRRGKKM